MASGAGEAVAEARTLLVGPVDQFDRRLGDEAEVVQGAHDLQPRQHAKRPVELASTGLAVEMAAHQHGQTRGIASLPAGEHVADGVHADLQAKRLAIGAEAVASGLVHGGQGETPHATLRRGADLGIAHERVPQALVVDALVGL